MKNGGSAHIETVARQVLAEVTSCVSQVPGAALAQVADLIEDAPRIFIAGVGRSGLCMRAFAMRLMHLGKHVYVVGETTTPRIKAKDLLILGSGSGETAGLLAVAQEARSQDAGLILFTTEESSSLANLADCCLIIPAPAGAAAGAERGQTSLQPMGSLFEQSLLILCDTLIMALMARSGVSVSQMLERHANLE